MDSSNAHSAGATAAVAESGVPKPIEFWKPGTLVAILAVLYLALNELSSLSAGFLYKGLFWSFNDMSGPGAWSARVHWDDQLSAAQLGQWRQLLWTYELIDVVFVATYAFSLLLVLASIAKHRELDRVSKLQVWVWVLVALEGIELVGQLFLSAQRCYEGQMACAVPGVWVLVVTVVTELKWLVVLLLALGFARAGCRASKTVESRLRELWPAVKGQRFSLLAFLPIAMLAVLPLGKLNNVFDQLPDVERAWLDGRTGFKDAALAAVSFIVVVIAVFCLGRIRADWAARRVAGHNWWPFYNTQADYEHRNDAGRNWEMAWGFWPKRKPGERRQSLLFWLAGPVVVLVLAGVALARDGDVFWARLVAFVAVPLLVMIGSLVFRWFRLEDLSDLPDRSQQRFANDTMAVGDIITVAALSSAGLGLVRAFAGVEALGRIGVLRYDAWGTVLLLVGVVLAVVPWLLSFRVLQRLDSLGKLCASSARSKLPVPAAQKGDEDTANETEAEDGPAAGHAENEPVAPQPQMSIGQRTAPLSASRALSRIATVLTPGVEVGDTGGDPRWGFKVAVLLISGGLFVFLAIQPRGVANLLGALGVATLALGTLVVMLGITVAYLQDRQPPEVFQRRWIPKYRSGQGWCRESFHATPVVTLLLIALVAATWVGKATDVHPIAVNNLTGVDPDTQPDRPDMAAAFSAWRGQTNPCTVPAENGLRAGVPARFTVRPMLLVAAEGGGIRAAYWTALALDRIGKAGSAKQAQCGRRSTLFSTGASGGAVGITVGRFSTDVLGDVKTMAGAKALSQAAVSLMTSDVLASAAGIRFATPATKRTPPSELLDRAGLMETQWEEDLPALRTNYLPNRITDATAGDGTMTGQLILTSSAARDGCRALLSQIDLSQGATYKNGYAVCGKGAAGDDSYDVFSAYGRTDAGDGTRCIANVRALTAGLLASRFPYVTPSGVVGGCRANDGRDLRPVQLIDGGYTDNTGLGTILDLQDSWETQVRTHNDQIIAAKRGTLVVPMVVYLENGTGPEFSPGLDAEGQGPPPPAAQAQRDWWVRSWEIPEPLVPLIGAANASDHKVRSAEALAASVKVLNKNLCTPGTRVCDVWQRKDNAKRRVVVVQQQQLPSVQAPLGWVLSEASQKRLAEDMCIQAQTEHSDPPGDPLRRYGTLNDLLQALGSPVHSSDLAATSEDCRKR